MILGTPKLDMINHALKPDEPDHSQGSFDKVLFPANSNADCLGSQNEFNASLFNLPYLTTVPTNTNITSNGSMSMFRNGEISL